MHNHKLFICYILSVPVIVFVILSRMDLENFWYFWDFKGYWTTWENLLNLLQTEKFSDFVTYVFKNIREDDYNVFPIVIPVLFSSLLTGLDLPSRTLYILSITVTYIPLLALIATKTIEYIFRENRDYFLLTGIFFLFLFFPSFWSPTVIGYPDVLGLIFISFSIYITLSTDFSREGCLKNVVMLGVTLWLVFLTRRWYAYTVVSLYISLPFLNYILFNGLSVKTRNLILVARNFFLSGIISICCVITFQTQTLLRIISTSYSTLYEGYRLGVFESAIVAFETLGTGIVIFASGVTFFSFFVRKTFPKQFILIAFSFANLILSSLLFFQTQTAYVQHCLPFGFWLLTISCIGAYLIVAKFVESITPQVSITLIVCSLVIFYLQYFSNDWERHKLLPPPVPPLQMQNYSEYERLVKAISLLPNSRATVISSSGVLNHEMLITGSLILNIPSHIVPYPQIDKRDHLVVEPFLERYVIVADPIQLHTKPGSQLVVQVPAEKILKNIGIGQAYKEISGPFVLANGVEAYIYEKTRPYSKTEIIDFLQPFRQAYPEWEDELNIIGSLLSIHNISLGDKWGHLNIKQSSIITHPGENTPTKFNWMLSGINQLKITSFNNSCFNKDSVSFNIESGISKLRIKIPHGQSQVINVDQFNGIESTVTIEKNISVDCDGISIELINN